MRKLLVICCLILIIGCSTAQYIEPHFEIQRNKLTQEYRFRYVDDWGPDNWSRSYKTRAEVDSAIIKKGKIIEELNFELFKMNSWEDVR